MIQLCPTCDGRGQVLAELHTCDDRPLERIVCPACRGLGEPCPSCDGTGVRQ